jgi:hypothetical protein
MNTPTTDDLCVDQAGNLLDSAATVYTTGYRYLLTHRWTPPTDPAPNAVFILLNPSTATATTDDPTVRRCVRFARRERCGGLVILNLFAVRATDPRALARHPDPVGAHNDLFLRLYTSGHTGPVIAGWGVHGDLGGRAATVTARLRAARVELVCLGTTTAGHPRHPLYLRADTPIRPYTSSEDTAA